MVVVLLVVVEVAKQVLLEQLIKVLQVVTLPLQIILIQVQVAVVLVE